MLKKSLAIIVVGALASSTSFATTPLQIKKMFMKDKIKSSLASSHQSQNSQSKFSGTWVGSCNYVLDKETKLRINEDAYELSIMNLNEGNSETYSFDAIKSEINSSHDEHDSVTTKLNKINDKTLKLEYNMKSSSYVDFPSATLALTSLYTVNNNQLTINHKGRFTQGDKDEIFEVECNLKKAG